MLRQQMAYLDILNSAFRLRYTILTGGKEHIHMYFRTHKKATCTCKKLIFDQVYILFLCNIINGFIRNNV